MSFKHLSAVGIFAAACFVAPLAHATTFTVVDTTKLVAYRGTNPRNVFSGGTSPIGDVLGSEFDTQNVQITVIDGLSVSFKFYTDFDGSETANGYLTEYADIFLSTDGSPDTYEYAIAIGYQTGDCHDPYGSDPVACGAAKGFYDITGSNGLPKDAYYLTSQEIWDHRSGLTYGGKYVSPDDGQRYESPTVVTGGDFLEGWTVTKSKSCSGDFCTLNVTLTATNATTFYDVFSSLAFDGFWGTGDCGNDAIKWINIPVPEPGSIMLFAGGLLGLYGVRRRLAKKTS